MYTVLLVDDEPTVLEALSASIYWKQFGVDTIYTAADGCQALEILEKHPVDLLITDIKMPNMDGLTLLKEVRMSYPDIHCILLTAYGEFEYARAAIQLGVENYLLKPLNKEELEATIEKALDNLYTSRKNSWQLFRNNILLRWANGSIAGDELSERGALLDINLYLPEYCVVCAAPKSAALSLSAYGNLCKERLVPHYELHQFKDAQNRYVTILGGSRLVPDHFISIFTEEAQKLQLASMIVLSVGTIVKNAEDLSQSYTCACHLLDSLDPLSFDAKALPVLTDTPGMKQEADQFVQKLNLAFMQEDEALQSSLEELTSQLLAKKEKEDPLNMQEFLSHCLYLLFSKELPSHKEAQEQLHDRIRLFTACDDKEALKNDILELLKYSHLLYCYYIEQLSPITQSALRYIHKHYAENISIQDFCAKNKMSPAYLGYLFKKETGFFFNGYLTQYRIYCSIHLLFDTDLKINDIAQKVGFSYPSYFISCFKKQTGLSPIKYRTKRL